MDKCTGRFSHTKVDERRRKSLRTATSRPVLIGGTGGRQATAASS